MRILFLSRWLPYPADNGSKLRVLNVLKQLSRQHEIALVSFAERADQVDGAAEALAKCCSDVRIVRYRPFRPRSARSLAGLFALQPRSLVDTHNPEMAGVVLDAVRRHRPQLVVASQLGMTPYALAVRDVPLLLEEVEITVFRDGPTRPGPRRRRLRALLTWLKLRTYLRQILPSFAACTTVSEREREDLLRAVPGYANVEVVPNAVDLTQYKEVYGPAEPGSLVYSGALTYHANYDAVRHFLTEIHPLIAPSVPGLTFRITGSHDGVELTAMPHCAGVQYTGRVPDVRPIIARSWGAVVPLRLGGGTRLKILEAMALGTPVVSTTKGAEGLEVCDGEHVLLAPDPATFARRVVDLLDSANLRERLAAAARELVEVKYNWDVIGPSLHALADRAASGYAG
jgi:glycosyltransferase involved in cell wall biosynthesis